MKGVIFNFFENFIVDTFDEESWEMILDQSESDGVFVGPKTYDDKDFLKIVSTAITLKDLIPGDAIRLFGRYSFPLLMKHGGDLVSNYTNSIDMLLELDSIIHVEVKKLMEGAEPPKFNVSKINRTTVRILYISKRNLPTFVEGALEGLGEYFGEKVSYRTEQEDDGSNSFIASFTR